jgi:Flp pilus assembly pilin Flp
MIRRTVKRFIVEEEGMEMIEWAIVAVFFAVAGALIWGDVAQAVEDALGGVISCITEGTCEG